MRSSDWSSDVCSSDLFLTLEGTIWQFTAGTRDRTRISPDNFWHVQYLLDRPGNQAIQLALFYDYRNNVALYPQWQALFREHQPPALVVWGNNDPLFPGYLAEGYRQDLKDVEFHLLDTGDRQSTRLHSSHSCASRL